ncbi:hypothetical protein OH77DRAFT_1007123 [Trametes cingulata]|nr:hypothetical protein OH77DRAFT_1007123 [Trametes cingulata]
MGCSLKLATLPTYSFTRIARKAPETAQRTARSVSGILRCAQDRGVTPASARCSFHHRASTSLASALVCHSEPPALQGSLALLLSPGWMLRSFPSRPTYLVSLTLFASM